MPVPQIVTKDVWGAVERVESSADEVLHAWRTAGNLNYRQARQEAHQISGRNLLPGLPVIQISRHSPSLQNFTGQTFNPLHSPPHILGLDLGYWHGFLVKFCCILSYF